MPCWEKAGPEWRDRHRAPTASPAAAGVSPSATALIPAKPQQLGLAADLLFAWDFLPFLFFFFCPSLVLYLFIFLPPPQQLTKKPPENAKNAALPVKNSPGFAASPLLGSPSQSPPPPLQHREKETFFATANLSFETRNKARLFFPLFLRGRRGVAGGRKTEAAVGAQGHLAEVCFSKELVQGFVV